MKKIRNIILTALTILSLAISAEADAQSPAMTLEMLPAYENETLEASIYIDNASEYAAFQFDLVLPKGVKMTGSPQSGSGLGQGSSFSFADLPLTPDSLRSYRFLSAAIGGNNLTGKKAEVVKLKLHVAAQTKPSMLQGFFHNVKLSRPDGWGNTIDTIPFQIEVILPPLITVVDASRLYGDDDPAFEFIISENRRLELEGQPTLVTRATSTSPVGKYPIIVEQGTLKGRYRSKEGVLTINKSDLLIKAGNHVVIEDDPMPELLPQYVGFKNQETAEVLTVKPTVTTTATNTTTPGVYDVFVSGAMSFNYNIAYEPGTLTIQERDTVVVTARNYTRQYGEENPDFEYDVNIDKLRGEPTISCSATPLSPAGEYDIIIDRGTVANQKVRFVKGKLTVTKAPLTVSTGNYEMLETDEMPEFDFLYEGFRNGDNATSLTKLPVATCDTTGVSALLDNDDAVERPIVISGAESDRYDINYVEGHLTIRPVNAIVIRAKNDTITYGSPVPELSFECSDPTLVGIPRLTTDAPKHPQVGNYTISISRGSVTNRRISLSSATLTVVPAELTITAKSYTRKQDDPMPEKFDVTYSGFKYNDDETSLSHLPVVHCKATENSIIGTYPITVDSAEARNYVMKYVAGTMTIQKADLITITAVSVKRLYGDANPEWTYTVSGGTLKGEPEIVCNVTQATPAGEYPIQLRKGTVRNSNVKLVSGLVTIQKAPMIIKAGNYTMYETMPMPKFQVTYEGFKNNDTEEQLTAKPVFTCTATRNSEPGEYAVIISGAQSDNYAFAYENGTLTIQRLEDVTITALNDTIHYGDPMPQFAFACSIDSIDGKPLLKTDAPERPSVGTYNITVERGTVDYRRLVMVPAKLTILPALLKVKANSYTKKQDDPVADKLEVTYDGFKYDDNENSLSKLPTVTCEVNDTTPPGQYPIVPEGATARNYEFEYVNGIYTVTMADPVIITANSLSREYGDENPLFTYSSIGAELKGEPELICTADSASPAGTYYIEVRRGTVKNSNVSFIGGILSVNRAPLKISTGTYNMIGIDNIPEFTFTYDGFKNGETSDVLKVMPTATCDTTGIGNRLEEESIELPITIGGAEADNYDISYVEGKLIIHPYNTVIITAKNDTVTYGEPLPQFGYLCDDSSLDGEPLIACDAPERPEVGTYNITLSRGTVTNHRISLVPATLTVVPAPLTVTAESFEKQQDVPMPDELTVTYSGFKYDDDESVLLRKPEVSCAVTATSAPGTYDIVASGAEAKNYKISYVKGVLTVTEANLITLTVVNCQREYGEPNAEIKYTVEGGALNGTPRITCNATQASPVGTYDITIERGSVKNSNIALVGGTLTITKAPLQIAVGNYTMQECSEMPEFAVTYAGFKNGDTENVLDNKPVISCDASTVSQPGQYDIVVGVAPDHDYDITTVNGVLTVTQMPTITITALNDTITYGDPLPQFTFTCDDKSLTGMPEFLIDAEQQADAGTYQISVARGTVGYRRLKFVDGTLVILPAKLTVKAESYTKKQDEPLPETMDLVYSGFKYDDDESSLVKKATATCEVGQFTAPGYYPIVPGGASALNYVFEYVNGMFTVTEPDHIFIVAGNVSREYGEENPQVQLTVSGGILIGEPEIVCMADKLSPVGSYDIEVRRGSLKNSSVSFTGAMLDVTKAHLNVSVKNDTINYGDELPEFEILFEGFKNGETKEVLTRQPRLSYAVDENSQPGEYVISISGARANNYSFRYVPGRLVIKENTGIDETLSDGRADNKDVYTVSGQLVRRNAVTLKGLPAGIYIVGGKKLKVK